MRKEFLKRVLSILLTTMLIISLAACGSSADKKQNESTDVANVQADDGNANEDNSNNAESEETEAEIVKATESGNVLRAELGTTSDKEYVTSITFLDSLSDMPEEADDVFVGDLSEAEDGSVMGWEILNADGATCSLYIAGEGGVDAGEDCTGLFGDFTNVVSIEFNGCFYTGKTTDMTEMFYDNHTLQSLDLSSFDTTNVKDMSEMFYNCRSLTELNLDGWSTSNVKSMFGMFHFCNLLTELNIGEWDTSAVEDMGVMFCDCYSLETLSISSWNVSGVNSMSQMFFYCTSLTSLDIGDWDTSNVAFMKGMFNGCESLSSMDINGWDISDSTQMTDMFKGCNDEIIPDWYVNN